MRTGVLVTPALLLASVTVFGANLSDQDFVNQAAQINMTEAHLGQMAQRQAASPDVKQFAQRLETNHTTANQKLTSIASSSFQVPAGIDTEHQATIDRLKDATGSQFDEQFKQAIADSHQKAIDLFETASKELNNQQLRTYAHDQLSIMRNHLQLARDIGHGMTSKTDAVTSAAAPTAVTAAGESERSRTITPAADTFRATATEHGTVTKFEPGQTLELKIRDRIGRHVYDIAETQLSSEVPSNISVGSQVVVKESVDANGRRSIRIELEPGNGQSNP